MPRNLYGLRGHADVGARGGVIQMSTQPSNPVTEPQRQTVTLVRDVLFWGGPGDGMRNKEIATVVIEWPGDIPRTEATYTYYGDWSIVNEPVKPE
jgi:hypothetical protein